MLYKSAEHARNIAEQLSIFLAIQTAMHQDRFDAHVKFGALVLVRNEWPGRDLKVLATGNLNYPIDVIRAAKEFARLDKLEKENDTHMG